MTCLSICVKARQNLSAKWQTHAVFDTTDWLHNTLAYCTWATFNRNLNIIPPTATDLSSSSILNEKYVNHGGWSTHMHSNFSMLFRWKVHMTIRYYGIFIFPSPSLSLTSLRLVLWYCMANLNSNPWSTIPHIPTTPISYSFSLSNAVCDKVVPIHFPNLAGEGLPNFSRSRNRDTVHTVRGLRQCNGGSIYLKQLIFFYVWNSKFEYWIFNNRIFDLGFFI